jgi:hypothetical protein
MRDPGDLAAAEQRLDSLFRADPGSQWISQKMPGFRQGMSCLGDYGCGMVILPDPLPLSGDPGNGRELSD